MENYPTKEDVAKKLEEFGYPQNEAERMAEKVSNLEDEGIRKSFSHWWNTGEFDSYEAEGYSVPKLIEEYKTNPIVSFLNLDWIRRDPVAAKNLMKRGFDTVEVPSMPAPENPEN